jgi:hypothetical protein
MATNHGELTGDTAAVAVPVLGPDSVALAAIEVEVDEITVDTIAAVAPALMLAARGLSRELRPDRYLQPAESADHHTRRPSADLPATVAG